MNDSEEIAPAVASILSTARERGGGDERLAVDAESVPEAFAAAEDDGRVPVVAEVKPTSPTADGERTDDPVELAEGMVAGGAAALSVLTEPEHFGGSPETLRRIREAVEVPVLRKDFLLREAQLDTVAADVVLLIARFLEADGTDDLDEMVAAARDRGFQVLVEVHDRDELQQALDAGADTIGVNNRDLARLAVDLSTFESVAPTAPEDVTLLAESGIATTEDVTRMREAGADGLLVGSAIMDGPVRENTRRLTNGRETAMSDTQSGKFGQYGGQYVPEALMPAIEELTEAYERYVLHNEDGFMDEFRERIRAFGGRPLPLQYADQLSERYDTDVYLKREDLLHGGAHKLNNALGQVLLAKYMGKERIIAETGAGQHGTATAMAAAHLDMPCEIYMGETDINRQRPNVFRMRLNGAEVNPVTVGRGTLKEAISETMRDWARTVEDTHYVIGSIVGPHPFPSMVRDFHSVISKEAREQIQEQTGRLPDSVIACAGGGSNTMGAFAEFIDDEGVALFAVEAGGSSLSVDEDEGVAPNSASLSTGDEGVLHGARTKLLQDSDGQIMESHSVSAGLDYAGVGPELAHLVDQGRVRAVNVDDDAALEAFHRLSQDEGIIPALETAHAFGYLEEHTDEVGDVTVVNVSGRGDKDLETAIEETTRRDMDVDADMSMFEDMGGMGGGM